MDLYIVDDLAVRGECMLSAALSNPGVKVTWLRPKPGLVTSEQDSKSDEKQVLFSTRNEFIEYIKKITNKAVWLWDMKLIFEDENFSIEDYYTNGEAFNLLKTLLNNGSVVHIISSDFAATNIAADLVSAGCSQNSVRGYNRNYGSLKTDNEKNEFCNCAIQNAVTAFKGEGSIRSIWKDEWEHHFVDGGDGLPHEYNNSQGTWNLFVPVLTEIIGAHKSEDTDLIAVLKESSHGYFEATKALIGHYAICHVGEGHPPGLSVLSLLTMRAAIKSGVWTKEDLILLAKSLMPNQKMRQVMLSCPAYQKKEWTQNWIEILADNLLPALVIDKDTGQKAKFTCKYNYEQRLFKICIKDVWADLVTTFHNMSLNSGSTSKQLKKLNIALGDCGPEIGRRQISTVNVWTSGGMTHIDIGARIYDTPN